LTHTVPRDSGAVFRARVAIAYVFFVLGMASGLWAVHIPLVQARLGLDEAMLGLVLLTVAAGSVVAMPTTGIALPRWGSRPVTALAAAVCPVVTTLPLLAPSVPLLFLAALFFGFGLGWLDVSMNTQAAEVETARGRPSMSALHGFYSLGGLVGAGVAALIIQLGLGDGSGAVGVCAVLLAGVVLLRAWLLPSAPHPAGPRFALPSGIVLAAGLLAFLCFGLEGAVADWSALFLVSIREAGPVAAAAGYALFSAAMATMRFIGDGIVSRLGPPRILLIGGILIAIGTAVALGVPYPPLAALGFGLIGIGAANIVPVLFSAGARLSGSHPAAGVAAVATLGYAGFLSWPPVIGFIADGFSLPAALALIGVAGVVIALGSRSVVPR